jgi:hypothetical protein
MIVVKNIPVEILFNRVMMDQMKAVFDEVVLVIVVVIEEVIYEAK